MGPPAGHGLAGAQPRHPGGGDRGGGAWLCGGVTGKRERDELITLSAFLHRPAPAPALPGPPAPGLACAARGRVPGSRGVHTRVQRHGKCVHTRLHCSTCALARGHVCSVTRVPAATRGKGQADACACGFAPQRARTDTGTGAHGGTGLCTRLHRDTGVHRHTRGPSRGRAHADTRPCTRICTLCAMPAPGRARAFAPPRVRADTGMRVSAHTTAGPRG